MIENYDYFTELFLLYYLQDYMKEKVTLLIKFERMKINILFLGI